ncbi:hypothetical protein Bca101_061480 [Brassica carinata]
MNMTAGLYCVDSYRPYDEDEKIARRFKEEVDRIRAIHVNRRDEGELVLSSIKRRVLKVSWVTIGEEVVVTRSTKKKCSAFIVMATKDGARKSTKRNSAPEEEQHEEELSTGNDSDDQSAHGNEYDHLSAHAHETDHESASSQECQPLPPDELYFKNTEYTKTCKIQSKCYVSNTVGIIKKLEPEYESPELKWFENHPQFCHLFHMPDEPYLKLLGVWMLLLRTIPLDEEEDTAWFAVNGVPIRYSMREHGLISGLDCRGYPDKYEKLGSYAFVDRHFQSHKEITMKSVEEKLLSMKACGDRLRMAVLYFLGTVIRGRGRYNAHFDPFILRMANNLELCKTFPWGRLTFDDNLRSIKHVMKRLKGKAKKNVNFPGFVLLLQMLAFECIPALNAQFREHVGGCLSNCPRICKWQFQNNSMKGFPLEDLYNALGETKIIKSVLAPTVEEETFMARIMEDEPDYENEGPSNLWSSWLTVKEKPIWWKDLYELDVAAREFSKKKDKGKVIEEAYSFVGSGLEDVLKGFEERLMAALSEVCVKVEAMDKRLGVVEHSHVVLKRRSKRMKAMEKKVKEINNCQYHLKRRARKQKYMEERLDDIEKEMKKQEKENNDGYNDGFDWNGGRYDRNGVDADMVENTEVVESPEGQRDQGQKEPESEAVEAENKEGEGEAVTQEEKEPEAEAEEDKEPDEVQDEVEMKESDEVQAEKEPEEVQAEKEPDEVQAEKEPEEARVQVETEVQADKKAEKEPNESPTPSRGRTKAEAARRGMGAVPATFRKLKFQEVEEPEKLEEEVEEPEKPEEEAEEMVEDEVEEPEEGVPAPTRVKHRPKAVVKRKNARKPTDPKKFTTPEQTARTRTRSWLVSTPFTEADTDKIEGRKKKPRTEA